MNLDHWEHAEARSAGHAGFHYPTYMGHCDQNLFFSGKNDQT